MYRLTAKQELNILNLLTTSKEVGIIGAGASRVVFSLPNKDLVVKLAAGFGGWNQNNREAELYEEYGDSCPLAKIYARGTFIILMESVDPISELYRNECQDSDDIYEGFSEDYGIDQSEAYEVASTIVPLEELNGCTSDNFQLGRNKFGNLVAYDYGFISGYGCSDQCSGGIADEICGNDDFFEYYIDKCKEVISNKLTDSENMRDFDNAMYKTINEKY